MSALLNKFICPAAIFFVLVFPVKSGRAQPENDEQPPPAGMELIKVGNTEILIPQGTKVTRKGAQLILEPPEQFWSRRIKDMEEEISRLREDQQKMKEEIENLKQSVNQSASSQKK